MSLQQFSNAIRSVVPFPGVNDQINQVCSHVYQTQAEAGQALNTLRVHVCESLSQQLQAIFDAIAAQALQAAPANVLKKSIIEPLSNGRQIPQVCRLLCDGEGDVLQASLLERCRSSDPVLLFRAFGIKLSGKGNEIQTFEQNARAARNLLPLHDQVALQGEITINLAIAIFRKADEIAQSPFIQNIPDGIFESAGAHEARAQVLQGLINRVGGNVGNIEFIFGRGIRDCAIEVRGRLPEADQAALAGEITIGKAIQIFRAASDESLLRLFRGMDGGPQLTGAREQDVWTIRDWLRERGNYIHEINGREKELLRFPLEILLCPHLRELNLSHNHLLSLPAEIAFLRELEVLNVSNNDLKVVPDGVNCLSLLRTLNACYNNLGGGDGHVPSFLPLTNLAHLDLSDSGLEDLNHDFFSLPNLTKVYLGGNYLDESYFRIDDPEVRDRIRSGELDVDITEGGGPPRSLRDVYLEEAPDSSDDSDSMDEEFI